MKKEISDCPCQNAAIPQQAKLLKDFERLREQCVVLRQVMVPDSIWPEFQKWDSKGRDSAQHRSILILSFEGGYISKITSPIHRYFFKNRKLSSLVNNNYLKDLKESWLNKDTVLERHCKARAFMGKLVELQYAEWIEAKGWKVTGLEAWGNNVDIVASDPEGVECGIEVKYLGKEDNDFMKVVESFSGGNGVDSVSPYTASNFVLFKVYEAAKQLLEKKIKNSIAVLIISECTWSRVEIPLKENWMNWQSPKFYNNDSEWLDFLQKKKEERRYRNIDKDLKETITSLALLKIMKGNSCFELSEEDEVLLNDCTSF